MAHADGLERDGLTTQAAAQDLHDILESLPAFEPCYGPAESWHEDLRKKRLPVWDLWPEEWRRNPPVKVKDTWWALGRGWLVMCDSECRGTKRCRVADSANEQARPEAVQRVFGARANAIPDGVRVTLTNEWRIAAGISAGDHAEPEVFARNDWYERRMLVREVMPRVLRVLDLAIRAVRQANGNGAALVALKKDELLHDETRDRAVAQLREVPHVVYNPPQPVDRRRGPQRATPQDEGVALVLDLGHRYSLQFLLHACYSLGCYRDVASGLAQDRTRLGKVRAVDVQRLQDRMEKSTLAAEDLKGVYVPAWSLLVDAHPSTQGTVLAFQTVFDMSCAAVANWKLIRSSVPGDGVLDLIISTGTYILCSEEKAKGYWSDINAEFARARHKHGLPPRLFRHPQADELAAMDAMLGDLLLPTAVGNTGATAATSQAMAKPMHDALGKGCRISPPVAHDDGDRVVTLDEIATETGIKYSTLASRRQRLPLEQKPKQLGRDPQGKETYRRSDWNNIVAEVRKRVR